jgi:hypothetical protein
MGILLSSLKVKISNKFFMLVNRNINSLWRSCFILEAAILFNRFNSESFSRHIYDIGAETNEPIKYAFAQ